MIRDLIEDIGGDTSRMKYRIPQLGGYQYSEMFGDLRVYMDTHDSNPYPWASIHDLTEGHVATFQFKNQELMLNILRLILGKEEGDA